MKKQELINLGKEQGYLVISEVAEVLKECRLKKEDMTEFYEQLEKEKINLVEKEPDKNIEKVKKVKEIKTFEERKNELIELGKKEGKITYEQLASALKGLDVDNDSLDVLYNELVSNNIDIIGEDDQDSDNNESDANSII